MRTLLSCLLGVFCLPAAVHASEQPFVVSISAEAPAVSSGPDRYTVKVGSEVFVTAHLTNTSKKDLAFGYDGDSRTGVRFAHVYEVRDSDGESVQKRAIMHPEIGSTSHGWPAREYRIQLLRAIHDDPKDGFVKSNTITVTVTR